MVFRIFSLFIAFQKNTCIILSSKVTSHKLFGGAVYGELHPVIAKLHCHHPPDFSDSDAQSVLEMLFGHYSDYARLDNEIIRQGFEKLYEQLDALCLKGKDRIIDSVCFLCQKHEKSGFTEGVKIGMRLQQELKND